MAIIWSAAELAKLYRRINNALDAYISYCHHAAAAAPYNRDFWENESTWAESTQLRLIDRTIAWMSYSVNQDDSLLIEDLKDDF